MNDKWVEFAIRIQSIAQAGLQYGKDKYDRERYDNVKIKFTKMDRLIFTNLDRII